MSGMVQGISEKLSELGIGSVAPAQQAETKVKQSKASKKAKNVGSSDSAPLEVWFE